MKISKDTVLQDYYLGWLSRITSLRGRKEVLGGKAKFGIFGDGKELPQLALAHFAQKGDWRSGYYRDQTMMFALGESTVREFFSQLYADPDTAREPASGGRQMNSHYGSRLIGEDGTWLDQTTRFCSSSDISPTGGQMARMVGLGYASKLYRQSPALATSSPLFTRNGNEVVFGTIGNASTSEGLFWESLNAAGVLEIPLVLSIWDDGYGISVPNEYQTTKGSIYSLLAGFAIDERSTIKGSKGFKLFTVKGHDYEALIHTYETAVTFSRQTHIPSVVHVDALTQPQGHSTSGSHERYKSKERMNFETEMDGLKVFRDYILGEKLASASDLDQILERTEKEVDAAIAEAWQLYQKPIEEERAKLLDIYAKIPLPEIDAIRTDLKHAQPLFYKTLSISHANALLALTRTGADRSYKSMLIAHIDAFAKGNKKRFQDKLLSEDARSPLIHKGIPATYADKPENVDGRMIIQSYFDQLLAKDPRVFVIGEDVGKLGGVNLEFEGLNEKHSALRVTDTGIREATILGQGIGTALRGLRPIVDIQYLDYLAFCLEGLTDDLATTHYRSAGGQKCPVIVRTKGHRLEGIWHTGSPMGMILGAIRGMHLCVPRNGTQAAGMYQTLMEGDDPGLVIEVLNGYRLKEKMPTNLGTFRVELGVPEILNEGSDITLVTYGANVRIAESVLPRLLELGISVELIDVQTLLPFDKYKIIAHSIQKTNAVLFFDEDVPGGATAFMMREVLETGGAYEFLELPPRTLSSREHRSAYGSDGDYYCKPSAEDLIFAIYDLYRERHPDRLGDLW